MNARFLAFKRHQDLLVAVRDLIQAGRSVSVSLIGSMDLGMDDITNLITELDLNDVVTIVPPRPHADMSALYHAHDVLILPSYNEAIGMVVPEAMACGIPTITSDTVGANVYVTQGVTGYIFNTGNVQDLSEKIDSCFDAVSLQKMGESARQEILKYSIPEIRSKWQQLL
jgi:glycosyltransferase involved in cell wall biosynthesis